MFRNTFNWITLPEITAGPISCSTLRTPSSFQSKSRPNL